MKGSDQGPGTPYFHVGIVVRDMATALTEIGPAYGLTFEVPRVRRSGSWRWLMAYSIEGPPFVELIEGAPGTPWHCTEPARLHHLGQFTDDLDAAIEDHLASGGEVVVDGRNVSGRWVYLTSSNGLILELIEADAEGRRRRLDRNGTAR